MEGPRPPADKEFTEVISFLNENLEGQRDWSIDSEYPTALTKENMNNIRIVKENGEIRSHAVLKYHLIKSPVGIFKVGAIGSVVTEQSSRKNGFSRAIIDQCLEAAKAHGCDFAILWTNLFDFYRKLGFELAGTEMALVLDKPIDKPIEGLRILESTKIDPNALVKAYMNHTVGSIRTSEDFKKYLSIPNTNLYTAWGPQNQLLAYAVEGKGVDLINYVHEWGGGVSKLLPLFDHIRRKKGEPITIIAPKHSYNLINSMKPYSTLNEGFLGMIKILNPKNMVFKIQRYAKAKGIKDLIFEYEDGTYYFGQKDQIFKCSHEADMTQLIFGPQQADSIEAFDKETSDLMKSVLPIPMWIWGWDSI